METGREGKGPLIRPDGGLMGRGGTSAATARFKSLRHHHPIEHLSRPCVGIVHLLICLPHEPGPDFLPILEVATPLKMNPLVRCSRALRRSTPAAAQSRFKIGGPATVALRLVPSFDRPRLRHHQGYCTRTRKNFVVPEAGTAVVRPMPVPVRGLPSSDQAECGSPRFVVDCNW